MVDYEVYASRREHGCEGGDITGLSIIELSKMLSSTKIIEMIEHGDRFWSNVYRNGNIIRHTRIEIEIIDDKVKGRYLRTRADITEENNLLELPIYSYNSDTKQYESCF